MSLLLAAALTLLFFVTPHAYVRLVAIFVASVASIPILHSNHSIAAKVLWLMALAVPAVILCVLNPPATGWWAD